MMIKCPECGKEISSKAVSCPHCGCPISAAQSKVVDAEVEPLKEEAKKESVQPQQTVSNCDSQIQQYESEIKSCQHKRTVMITWGSILSALSIIGIIVFTILLALGLARELPNADANPELAGRLVGIVVFYYCMIILFAFAITGGIALIVVGAVSNTVKIKKRENKIRQLRENK